MGLWWRQRRHQKGFTLIELMVVVGLLGIISALAVGMSTDWRRKNTFRRAVREIYVGLNAGRAEAIRTGKQVTVRITAERMDVWFDTDKDLTPETGETWIHQFPVDPDNPATTAKDAAFFASRPTWENGITVDTAAMKALNAGQPVGFFDFQGFHLDRSGEPRAVEIAVTDAQLGQTQRVDVTIAGALRVR